MGATGTVNPKLVARGKGALMPIPGKPRVVKDVLGGSAERANSHLENDEELRQLMNINSLDIS